MEFIYEVDTEDTSLRRAEPVTFSAIGVKERGHMEQWVVKNPDVLGEPLLVITTQFRGFDKSSRRLDILALDKAGTLVVVELKLNTQSTHADLQAIRYAAFCSTMTASKVVELLARFEKTSREKAQERIKLFLEEEGDLLKKPPRIILAAGSFDQEITASVLWLREFALDIACVQITPYRLGTGKIVLVPKVIIPLPEAKDYQVMVEQKKAEEARRSFRSPYVALWQRIAEEFNKLNVNVGGKQFSATPGAWHSYFQVYLGHRRIHYEWFIRKRLKQLEVCVHFETADRRKNLRLLKKVKNNARRITRGAKWRFEAIPWGESWAAAKFSIPYSCEGSDLSVAPEAARAMKFLIERTWPILRPALNK